MLSELASMCNMGRGQGYLMEQIFSYNIGGGRQHLIEEYFIGFTRKSPCRVHWPVHVCRRTVNSRLTLPMYGDQYIRDAHKLTKEQPLIA